LNAEKFFCNASVPADRKNPLLAPAGAVGHEPLFTSHHARPHARTHGQSRRTRGAPGLGRERWSRPVSRVLYALRRDSHSSRPGVAAWLQQPTRGRRGPRQCPPIWSCSEWGLPCRTALAPYAVRSYRTLSPLPVPLRAIGGLLSVALAVGSRRPGVTWHSALWSPDFPRCACARRDCPADSIEDCSAIAPTTFPLPSGEGARRSIDSHRCQPTLPLI